MCGVIVKCCVWSEIFAQLGENHHKGLHDSQERDSPQLDISIKRGKRRKKAAENRE